MISQFIIGPQLGQSIGNQVPNQQTQQAAGGNDFIDVFAPSVWLTNAEGKLEQFKMFVFLGFKTMLVCLFKHDVELKTKMIRQLHAYANR